MKIDFEKYKVSPKNYYSTHSVKTQIVIGTSLRKDNNHIIRLQHKDFGMTKKWNTYTISRNGSVYQHYDDKYYSDFLGIKEGDKRSISIVLENMGALFMSESNDYCNWLNEKCSDDNIIKKKWLGYDYWELIPSIQIKSLIDLCDKLCNKYNIPKEIIDFHHHHKEIHNFKGIVFRGNYIEDSSDMSAGLNINELSRLLRKKIN